MQVRTLSPAPNLERYQMFSWFKRKEDWLLVKTITEEVARVQDQDDTGKAYFHLFESDKGNRRVEYSSTLRHASQESLIYNLKRLDIYQGKIYRWEMGRHDPDIPRYDQIPEEETVNALRGKVS